MQAPPPAAKKSNTALIVTIAAVVLGVCGLGGVLLAAVLMPVFSQARVHAKKTLAMSEMKRASLAVLLYASDHDDRLPIVMADPTALRKLVAIYGPDLVWTSPNPAGGEFLGNGALSGIVTSDLANPPSAPVLYESMPWFDEKSLMAGADGAVRAVSHIELESAIRNETNLDGTPLLGAESGPTSDQPESSAAEGTAGSEGSRPTLDEAISK